MPSWDEVRAHLKETFTLAMETEELVGLVFRFRLPEGERVQAVRVSPVQIAEEPWVVVLADLCPDVGLSTGQAIDLQGGLLFGALVVRKGIWLLRHSLPMDRLAWPDLDRAPRLVAHEGMRIRRLLGGIQVDAGVFSSYED